MSAPQVFPWHADPGHAWLEVPAELVAELGIDAQVSRYSYQHDGRIYLEEDCDAARFLNAWTAHHRGPISTPETYENPTPIRGYEHYAPPSPAAVILSAYEQAIDDLQAGDEDTF